VFLRNFENLQRFFTGEAWPLAMAAMNMLVSAGGFEGELSFKEMSAGGRLCTLQENPHFWVPTIKVRPPDVYCLSFVPLPPLINELFVDLLHF
jgi:hypothetical protein